MLWNPNEDNNRYRNPILCCDYSDPDVIRVDGIYYMTASSFNYVPGLPILTSKDLVNWKLENYAVQEIPYPDYDSPAHGRGIWAPSIRYHRNRFHIVVGMPDEGIFVTSAADPLGEWSPLRCIREARGFIDPCPFWDDDGQAYVIHAYAKSRIGFKSKLGIFPVDPESLECIGDDRYIFDGTETQPTIEGPKVYKRDGLYYIFAPAGGVETGWQTVLRSSSIHGPFEEKIVLHQGGSKTNGPHQGGLVDTPEGEQWFIHFQDKGVYGRITHLQPVVWTDGWPLIGIDSEGIGIGEPVDSYRKPSGLPAAPPEEEPASDDFKNGKYGLQWQWIANPKNQYSSLTDKEGTLRLFNLNTAGTLDPDIMSCANIISQKIVCPAFQASAEINLSGMKNGDRSGLTILGNSYACLEVRKSGDQKDLYLLQSTVEEKQPETDRKVRLLAEDCPDVMVLRLVFSQGGECRFSASAAETTICNPTEPFIAEKGRWVGGRIGMYAISTQPDAGAGYTDISLFRITALKEA